MAQGARRLLEGLALGILLATGLRALLSTLFGLSLATLRLNWTALGALALLSPLLALRLRPARWPVLVAGAATVVLPFARYTPALVPVAMVAVAAGLLALAQADRLSRLGALVGLVADGALLVAGGTYDPLLAPWGALAPLALAALALLAPRPEPERQTLSAGAAWGALLAAEVAFLASPAAVARHVADVPAWAAAAAGIVGVGLGLVALPPARPLVLLAMGGAGLLGLVFAEGGLALLALGLLQAALSAAAARLGAPHGATLALTLGGALFALLFYGAVLGTYEWRAALPLLCVAALLAALARAPRLDAPRAPTLALVAAALLLLPAGLAEPRVEPHQGDAIVVVTWNVHQGFGNRGALDPEAFAAALRPIRPDVLILQEADTARLSSGGLDVRAYLARELGLRVLTPPSGVAVLSRFPLANGTTPAAQEWTATVALDAHGTPLHVQGVHLARNPADRAAQVDEVLRIANATTGPLILAGDLNSCASGPCFGNRPSDGVHQALATAYRDAWSERHAQDDPAGHTHPTPAPRRRIDVVMVRGLDVLDAAPLRNEATALGSDHLPVVARVGSPASGSLSRANSGLRQP